MELTQQFSTQFECRLVQEVSLHIRNFVYDDSPLAPIIILTASMPRASRDMIFFLVFIMRCMYDSPMICLASYSIMQRAC